jgi:DNA helicase-2/ATP-dependent DNA helicase PcrA
VGALLENLNEQQLQAVTSTSGPLLIVAGAGTGKTTVITRRIAYLMEQKLARPEEILALTFTEKAASEMEERVDQLLPLGNYDLWISTFHSFCERLLKQHGLDIGLSNEFKLLNDIQQWILLYENFDNFKLDYYKPLGSPNKFIDALLYHFSKCKDELITPEDYLKYSEGLALNSGTVELLPSNETNNEAVEASRANEIANAYHVYQKLLLDNEFLDFGDLINYAINLLEKRPNILAGYRKKFKYILIDEFQDTNFAQYKLIKLLTEPKTAQPNPQLVVVGDDDQSIYKFRGASVSNILNLKKDFPGVKEITLTQNYRSSQAILDLAYEFIQANNPNRLETELGIDKRLTNKASKKKAVIEVLEGKDLSEELDLVVKKVTELKAAKPNLSWNDFAILIRANSAADEVLPRLDAAGVPYNFVANRGLYKKRLILDLINYLLLLDNHHESASLYRLLNFPKFQIDHMDLAHLTQYSNKHTLSLYETLTVQQALAEIKPVSRKRIAELLAAIEQHSKQSSQVSAVELFVTIVEDLGVAQILEEDTLENAEQREHLDQFYKRIETYSQENSDRTLRGFINYLNLELKAGEEGPIKFDPNTGPESLKVMTIHAAKGLEFENVFLINLVDQRFPTRGKKDAIEIPEILIKDILPEGDFHLQEERRLFYVAITRAKTNLYFSWGRDYGGAKLKKPSLFLEETKLVPSEKTNTATGKVVFTKPGRKPKKAVYKHLPTSFSYSQISQFLNCPLDYKYRYYLKLPMPGAPQLSFGITVHAVFQQFMELYQAATQAPQQDLFSGETTVAMPSFETLENFYAKLWVDEWYETKAQKEAFRAKGKNFLKIFYNKITGQKPTPKYIEKYFRLELADDKEKFAFVGKIDRADSAAAGLAIIDYKTGKAPTAKKAGDLDQLRVYQWAAEEYLHEPVELLCYWYLDGDQTLEVPLATAEEMKKLKASLLETIQKIRHTTQYDLFAEEHKKTKQHSCNFADLL